MVAGLRMGYARDANIDAYASSSPLPLDAHSYPTLVESSEDSAVYSHANGHTDARLCYSGDKADASCRLEQIKSLIYDKLDRSRQSISSVSSARKDFIATRRKAAHNLHLASIAYADLVNQLNDAYEAEDFETAERLSETLAAADKDKKSFIALLKDAESQYDHVELTMQEVLTSQIAAEEECASH